MRGDVLYWAANCIRIGTTWQKRHGCGADLTQQLTSSPVRKHLDESSFQQLLAAAYVLQQHNEQRGQDQINETEILSEIVQIRRQIRKGQLNLIEAANLIAEQTKKFTGADGVAIGIVTEHQRLIYLAGIGCASRDVGLREALDASFSAHCFRTAHSLQSFNVQDDPRVPAELRNGEVQSFIAVPISYDSRVVSVIEARSTSVDAFQDRDVNTCELMAGLVREVIMLAGRHLSGGIEIERSSDPSNGTFHDSGPVEQIEVADEPTFEAAPSNSRSVFSSRVEAPKIEESMEASSVEEPFVNELEQDLIQPQQEEEGTLSDGKANVGDLKQASNEPRQAEELATDVQDEPDTAPDNNASEVIPCWGCGENLSPDESFCGKCGTERSLTPEGALQSKWASLWFINQARQKAEKEAAAAAAATIKTLENKDESLVRRPLAVSTVRMARPRIEEVLEESRDESIAEAEPSAELEISGTTQEAVTAESASPTNSVRLEWLPVTTYSENWLSRQWRVNRANFYLAGALLLLIIALSTRTTVIMDGASANSSAPQLTLFERALVNLGLAEAPTAPTYRGNPDTPVWEDLHTALYYCPGADLYGKTDGGRIATQLDAQRDQFEPAHRRACK